jgi:hypothetical protein
MFDSIHGQGRTAVPVNGAPRHKSSSGALRISILAVAMLAVSAIARGQVSPPIGPETYRSDKQQIGVGIITGMIKTAAEKIVADTNANLQSTGSSTTVRLLPFTFHPPDRIASKYTNRPNQWHVWMPTIIGINVDMPHGINRQVYISLDLNISCDGWQTGNGVVRVTAAPGPPFIEGGSILEDIIPIRDFVDGQVRLRLPQLAAETQTIPMSKCETIGASPNSGTFDPFAFIAYDAPVRRPIGVTTAIPRLEVSFIKLKRLRARGNLGSGVLYNPTESIMLDVYANFGERQSSVLTMKEDDEVTLNIPPVVFNAPLPGSLVLIANINQEPLGSTQDSAFAAALSSANYSPGVHTLQIPKHYVVPIGPGNRKPYIATTPAYELTYKVNYVSAAVRSPH